jgi:hypothetical protein
MALIGNGHVLIGRLYMHHAGLSSQRVPRHCHGKDVCKTCVPSLYSRIIAVFESAPCVLVQVLLYCFPVFSFPSNTYQAPTIQYNLLCN